MYEKIVLIAYAKKSPTNTHDDVASEAIDLSFGLSLHVHTCLLCMYTVNDLARLLADVICKI